MNILQNKFSRSFFPWKKNKENLTLFKWITTSASILSKIHLIERRQILRLCFQNRECFQVFRFYNCHCFYFLCACVCMCLLASTPRFIYQNQTKKMIPHINSAYMYIKQYSNFRARLQFLTSASLTFPTFSQKCCK